MYMFVQVNTINIAGVQLYFWPKYHQSEISMKTTHIFFILWPGFHWFFDGFSGIHGYFDSINWKPWVVFMKPDKKKMKPLRRPAGPEKFQFFFVWFHEYHPRFSIFCSQKYPWIPLKSSKKSMKSRSQNKKNMRGLPWNPGLVIFWPRIQLL